MNIKSLLLGSAAALAVVSGAQAADAVVAAEPEPMEYVKVCDAYGTGYFYIPGTETCLKVGGRVRVDMQAADSYTAGSAHGWRNRSRAELYMDSASDTEYGALKTNFVARWDFDGTYNDGAHTNPVLIAANISIAGLLAGQADSQYSSFIGYAGDIINDDVISYGGFEINQLTYTYDSGAGLKIMGSLEDDRKTFDGEDGPRSTNLGASIYKNGRDYLPNLVGGVSYDAGGFGFIVVGGYDDSEKEGAVKARVNATFGSVTAFVMGAWSSSGNDRNAFAPGDTYNAWGDWAAWAGIGAKFSDTLAGNLQVAGTDNDTLAVAANLKWYPVSGLLVMPEVTYTSWDKTHFDRTNAAGATTRVNTGDKDQWNGMLRLERTF